MLLQYLVTFCLAVARPELGLIILTFALASVGAQWARTSIAGLGSLQLSDFAILGLTANLLFHPRPWRDHKYGIWLLIVLWVLGIALIHSISRADGLKTAYDLAVRYGLMWLIPIIVAELAPAKRRTLLLGMLACGLLVTGIQAYTYAKHDPSFATRMYFQFQDSPAYNRPDTDARREFLNNAFPRLYPSGALLVQSLMVFALVNYMLSHRPKWSNWPMATLFCLYGLFFVSLRQRSGVIALAVALFLFLKSTRAGNRRLRPALRVVSIAVAGTIAVLVYQNATGASFLDDFGNRFRNENIFEQQYRVHDDWLALKATLKSPLAGTGAFDVQDLAQEEGRQSLGLDVHPLLSVAVLGGLPLLFLVLAAAWRCGKRGRLILFRAGAGDESIAAVISLAYMFCVAIMSFSQQFTQVRDMLPMLLFVGFIESNGPSHLQEEIRACTNSRATRTGPIMVAIADGAAVIAAAGRRKWRSEHVDRPNRKPGTVRPHASRSRTV
jgi:hypothetical protein